MLAGLGDALSLQLPASPFRGTKLTLPLVPTPFSLKLNRQ